MRTPLKRKEREKHKLKQRERATLLKPVFFHLINSKLNTMKDIFPATVTNKKVNATRYFVALPNDKIGITPWYSSEENLQAVRDEIKKAGNKIIKTENKTI